MADRRQFIVLNSGPAKDLAENRPPLPPKSQRIHPNANIIFGFAPRVN
jgi:hypothetical protein